jgi:tetratricopeptide (TPR) repeat protein
MVNNILSSLLLAQKMIEEEKISEALELLKALEPIDKFTEREKVIFYSLLSEVHRILGDFSNAYDFAEEGMKYTDKIEPGIEVVDLYLNWARIIHFMGRNSECSTSLEKSLDILNNSPVISENDRNKRLGLYYFYRCNNLEKLGEGYAAMDMLEQNIDFIAKWGSQPDVSRSFAGLGLGYVLYGEFSNALKYFIKSQKICKNKESPLYDMTKCLIFFGRGAAHWNKDDLQLALENIKKGISTAQKCNRPMFTHMGLNALGNIYYELADWDQSIHYYKKAISLAESIDPNIIHPLSNLHELYINMGAIGTAPEVFEKIEQYRSKETDNKWFNLFYRFNKALVLKKSERIRDLGKAQEIFSNITNEEVLSLEMTQAAFVNLCEMLLDEYKNTKNIEALNDLSPVLTRLREVAKKRHSHKILAETYVLDARLEMINFDAKKTRQALTKAQQIAEQYGLKKLAIKISNEHDNLLRSMKIWDQLKQEDGDLETHLENINIQEQISAMQGNQPEEYSETSTESPMLVLIMAESGIPVYTKTFSEDWKVEEQLFSGFITAFNSFSSEIFKEGLDRANFGEFTILMTNVPPFRSCYVFEGQSFLAQQKFSKFNKTIKNSEAIWEKLTSSSMRGRVVRDSSSEELKQLIKTTFDSEKE